MTDMVLAETQVEKESRISFSLTPQEIILHEDGIVLPPPHVEVIKLENGPTVAAYVKPTTVIYEGTRQLTECYAKAIQESAPHLYTPELQNCVGEGLVLAIQDHNGNLSHRLIDFNDFYHQNTHPITYRGDSIGEVTLKSSRTGSNEYLLRF